MRHHTLQVFLLLTILGLLLFSIPSSTEAQTSGTTSLISVHTSGTQGDALSADPSISVDSFYVSYTSLATTLAAGDSNGVNDIYLRNRNTNATTRVSVSSSEAQANGASSNSSVSQAGRFVVFESAATNLVSSDTNGSISDIFIRDVSAGTTALISVSTTGTQGNGGSSNPHISPDGRYVVFESAATNLITTDTNGRTDVFLRDRQAGTTERISLSSRDGAPESNGNSSNPRVTPDGRYVVFTTLASNLVLEDDNANCSTNTSCPDIYLRDRQAGITERISVTSTGEQPDARPVIGGADISADGRYVVYSSDARTMVPNDTNFLPDIFLRDRTADTTTRVSVTSAGGQTNHQSLSPVISSDGVWIVYESQASNIVTGDTNGVTDVFRYHRPSGTPIERVSVSSSGAEGDSLSQSPAVSSDGLRIAFASSATNLAASDSNGVRDIFLRNYAAGDPTPTPQVGTPTHTATATSSPTNTATATRTATNTRTPTRTITGTPGTSTSMTPTPTCGTVCPSQTPSSAWLTITAISGTQTAIARGPTIYLPIMSRAP